MNFSGTVHVWTSGRRSNDTNWYYVNNERVPQDIFDKTENEARSDRCAYIDNNLKTKTVEVIQCYEKMMAVLCQRSAPCDPDDINYKGLCYHLYQDQSGLDWNRARQYCRGRHDSDMAYLHITDNDLVLLLNTTKRYIWIGLSSRTWIWVNDTSDIKMNYTKFRGGVSTGKCVIIDPNDNGKWDADDCQDENKYFICERIKSGTTTTTTTTSTITTAATTTQSSKTSTKNANNTNKESSKYTEKDIEGPLKLEYIIAIGVVGGLVLLVIIIIIMIYNVRKKKTTDNDDTSLPTYSNHIELPSNSRNRTDLMTSTSDHPHSTTDGNPYSEMPNNSYSTAAANPYSEIPGNSSVNTAVDRHSEMSSNSYPTAAANPYSEIPGNSIVNTATNVSNGVTSNDPNEIRIEKSDSVSKVPHGYKMSTDGTLYAVPNKGKNKFTTD
ncbi:hypothetical protein LSH36_170g03002 [Paralvinella palmiformis]|uniref:C-type lectin domain-containing protein n=1 Tax=Paralvinella palmiformis TaxID=53620 RepID=A0AAD9JSN1_9ANNE|nr:hypothetical protein LSH36_170g03002 [Paralvinella palmiformis]